MYDEVVSVSVPRVAKPADALHAEGLAYCRVANRVLIKCGKCGMLLTIADRDQPGTVHSVDDTGRATPSIGHPDCGWHVFAKLEDWTS